MLVVLRQAYGLASCLQHACPVPCWQVHGQQQPSLQLTSSAAWTRASQQMVQFYRVTYSVYGCHVVSM